MDKNVLLHTWAEHAGVYKWLHDRSSKQLFNKKLCVSIPLLMINTLSGILVYSATSFNESKQSLLIFEYIVGTLNIFCVLLTGVRDYCKFGEKSELHIQSFQQWTKFKNEIYVELVSPSIEPDLFLCQMKTKYINLVSVAPRIPNDVIEKYEKELGDAIDYSRLPDIIDGTGRLRANLHVADLDSVV